MNDRHLRCALKRKVLARHENNPDTRIIEELGLRHGVARVDIAVVNGIIHGFELKSDKDGHLYIRTGNSTRQLNPKETVDYCKMHWQ